MSWRPPKPSTRRSKISRARSSQPARNAIRLQKSLILDWEELPTAAAVQRGIDCFVSAYDTDEPARMAGAMLAELRARRRPPP